MTLGFSTTTEDASGEKSKRKIDQVIQRKRILEVLESLTGKIEQTPPMFSAVKVNGKKLYEYARAGIDVERPTREVTIYDITLLDDRSEFKGNHIFRFRVNCSKGTYIRTLAVMMGEELGFPAHMSDLTRIESAGFKQEDCFTFSEVEEFMENGQTDEFLLPLERGLFHLPKFQISDKVAKKVLNGAVLEQTKDVVVEKGMPFVMVDPADKAIAIYQIHPTKEGLIKPVKVLAQEL